MANDIAENNRDNDALWEKWLEFGIIPGTDFPVDFRFYSVREDISDALISGLTKSGITATKEVQRTLIIFKGWQIKATITKAWTLDDLNQQCAKFSDIAEKVSISFEGCGAYMPARGAA